MGDHDKIFIIFFFTLTFDNLFIFNLARPIESPIR